MGSYWFTIITSSFLSKTVEATISKLKKFTRTIYSMISIIAIICAYLSSWDGAFVNFRLSKSLIWLWNSSAVATGLNLQGIWCTNII
jgi:hypothetical protein